MATQPPVDYSQNSTPPQGRKRQGEFPGSEGGGFGVPGDDGFRKKPRFDGPPGPGESDEVPPSTLRVLIRNTDAGGIIGKGGENIKRLRKQYDCQVVLPDSAGAPERVMTMMGSTSSCISVLEDVLKGLAADARSSQPGDGDREVQILIPQQFMGTIIGTGGAKIKELRQRTKTNIKIFSDPMPRSNERSVQLMGSIAQIVECVQHILDDIGKKEPREPIYLYEPGRDMGPMDMGFQPRGRGRGGFRGRGRGRGGGDWRGGRGGGASRGRGGHFNGNNPGGMQYGSQHPPPPQAQYSSPSQPAQGYTAPPPPAGGVGYGVGATAGVAANQPSVGYTANQSPVPAANMSAPPTGMVPPPTGAYPPPPGVAQAPGTVPVPVYPQQQGPPSQPYPHQVPPNAPNTPNVGGTQSQQVTIPAEYADAITGLNGSNLQQIKTQSSCDINLEPPKPGTGDRIITITGTPNGIQFAQQLMQNSVRQHHNV